MIGLKRVNKRGFPEMLEVKKSCSRYQKANIHTCKCSHQINVLFPDLTI